MSGILYSTQFGSRLFGTSTPQSDTDIKHIILPEIGSLLRGRTLSNRSVTTNELTKNGPEDVDVEYVPLQCLARDFYEGQTYALEIAYSIDGSHAGQTHYDASGSPFPMDPSSDFCLFIAELKERFLTSNIKAMMGYVLSQASLYSLKGERLNAAKAVRDLLDAAPPCKSLGEAMLNPAFAASAQAVAQQHPHFAIDTYDDGKGGVAPCFRLLNKTIPFSVSIANAILPVKNCVKTFGHRAESASIDNVDWKATMHALRIVDEGISLMRHERISLPVSPDRAQALLSIRRGEVPLPTVEAEISAKVEILGSLVEQSSRPPISPELTAEFESWLETWLMRFYGIAKVPSPTPARRSSLGA